MQRNFPVRQNSFNNLYWLFFHNSRLRKSFLKVNLSIQTVCNVSSPFRLEKKRKQRNAQRKYREKAEKADKLRNLTQSGGYVIGVVSEWRGSYGFLDIAGYGSAFVHITDIHGRPFLKPGCRIHCQLREQVGHPRPMAVNASLMRY